MYSFGLPVLATPGCEWSNSLQKSAPTKVFTTPKAHCKMAYDNLGDCGYSCPHSSVIHAYALQPVQLSRCLP